LIDWIDRRRAGFFIVPGNRDVKFYRLGSLFQKNAHGWPRRLGFALIRRLTGVFGKHQSVHFVAINGRRYKRVVFGDSYEAARVANALATEPGREHLPALIHRHENELLVDYVEGRPFEPERPDDRVALAAFFGALYRQPRSTIALDGPRERLAIDCRFLRDAGLIDARLGDALLDRAAELEPAELMVGLDYVDAVAKNFVFADDRVVAIDIESLRDGEGLGSGIVKAGLHWLRPEWRDAFVAAVERDAGVTLGGQLAWLELAWRVGWVKRKLLHGKPHAIRVEVLRELVEPPVA